MTHVQKETAILLKEKGFDLPCLAWYIVEDEIMRSTTDYEHDSNGSIPNAFTAPELYKVPIWLRETKGVHVAVLQDNYDRWFYMIESVPITKNPNCVVATERYDTHNTGIEAGIVHALKNYVK